jgi:TPR repeat protein
MLPHIVFFLILLFIVPLTSLYAEEVSGESGESEEISLTILGQAAFDVGEYEKAREIWKLAADDGDVYAQLMLGVIYNNGWGTPKSEQTAAFWYQKAADNNNSDAQYLLGLLYLSSKKINDTSLGQQWLEKAAENGDIMASKFLNKARKKGWLADISE